MGTEQKINLEVTQEELEELIEGLEDGPLKTRLEAINVTPDKDVGAA